MCGTTIRISIFNFDITFDIYIDIYIYLYINMDQYTLNVCLLKVIFPIKYIYLESILSMYS